MREVIPEIEALAERAREVFAAKNAAREAGLSRSRETIRHSANAIRAVHRGEFDRASELVGRAGQLLAEAREALADHGDVLYAGFVHDAAKEFTEARVTLALISGGALPGYEELQVEVPAYLNGMAEAVGELRRYLLDRLNAGEVERCTEVLEVMDEVYGILVTFDFPDAMTGGLRRTTDNVRGILERTRGDLVLAVRQTQLEEAMRRFGEKLG
ncbi:MAG: haloacid dehalogenase [Dehalococcoidia bacterium]